MTDANRHPQTFPGPQQWTSSNFMAASQIPDSATMQWAYQSMGHPGMQSRMPRSNAGNGMMPGGQARSYDSLRHFGSLPQQTSRRNKVAVTSKTNLYVSGLQENDNDESVRALVDRVIVPKSSKAMMTNGKCKGSGFIDCASEEDAEKARLHIMELANTSGKKLSVKYAYENEKDALNVYVRNLPRTNFTKEKLEDMFKQFGQITSVKLLESSGTYTGTGFVRFATAEQATEAVEQMNAQQQIVGGNEKPVSCKLADKTDPRKKTVRGSPEDINGNAAGLLLGQQNPAAILAYQNGANAGTNGYIQAGMFHPGPQNGHPMAGGGAQAIQNGAQLQSLLASMQGLSLQNGAGGASATNISPHQMGLHSGGNSMGNGTVPASAYNSGVPQHASPYYQAYQGPAGPAGAYAASGLASSNMMAGQGHMYSGAYMMSPPAAAYMPTGGQGHYLTSVSQAHGMQQGGHQQQLNADATHFIPQQQAPYSM